jgi:hypothetical protein
MKKDSASFFFKVLGIVLGVTFAIVSITNLFNFISPELSIILIFAILAGLLTYLRFLFL